MGLQAPSEKMKTAALTDSEKRIAKKLLSDGETYQDVQQLVNTGRSPTVNPGRLAGWAKWAVDAASDDDVARFRYENVKLV